MSKLTALSIDDQLIRAATFSLEIRLSPVMNLFRFGFTLLFSAVLFGLSTVHAAEKKNVLFLIADDLNNFLGCYGDPLAKTPNIDKLAARGVRFDRAYCNFPLCGPSRNSMLTGLYPNSSGILVNAQVFRQTVPNQISLPQAFRQAGYFSARAGKLYHYHVPGSIGTDGHDDPASWEVEMNPAGVDRLDQSQIFTLDPGNFGSSMSWYASPKSDAHHTDAMLASDAEWVLERCAKRKDRPFFLAVGFFRPHTPYVAPKDPYFGWYPEEKMPLVKGIKEDREDMPAAALMSRRNEEENLPEATQRKAVQAYYASISFMDAQVGRVVDALDRLGLAESTIIVFTSDHGYHKGEHGLWKKMSLFEEGVRVPLLIVAPGTAVKGGVASAPVGLIDLYPTLTDLCGVKGATNLQGQSLAPMLKDPTVKGRGWALTQVNRRATQKTGGEKFFGYTLRTPRWRYTEWNEGKQGRELYDHDADPKELKNLAEIASHAKTVEELSAQLQAAVKSTFPASGQTPAVAEGMWIPMLVP